MSAPYIDPSRVAGAEEMVASILSKLAELAVKIPDLSLCSGLSGLAMVFSRHRHVEPTYGKLLDDLLDNILFRCAQGEVGDMRFYSGLPGVGFSLAYCLKNEPMDDRFDDLNELVCQLLAVPAWEGHFDLISGLVGLGVYALGAGAQQAKQEIVSMCISHLSNIAVTVGEETWWQTRSEFRGYESRNLATTVPNVNLGLAHGNAGVIGFLAGAMREKICVEQAFYLLRQATAALLSRQNSAGRVSRFGYVAGDSIDSRVAWCYGDLGNALMILRAGRVLANTLLVDYALEIATMVARRDKSTMNIHDHGLCHGSAGVGLLMSTLHRETGDPIFLDCARRFYRDVIEAGWAGLGTLKDDGSKVIETGLLSGLGGIAMALTDAMQEQSDGWAGWMLI